MFSLFGSALSIAGLSAFAGQAGAADFPKTPNVQGFSLPALAACPQYGYGFFRIPGSDICMLMNLDITSEYKANLAKRDLSIETTRVIDNPVAFYDLETLSRSTDRSSMRVDPRFGIVTATQIGNETLVTNTTFRISENLTAANSRGNSAFQSGGLAVDQAWLKYYGFTAGQHTSFFDFSPGYTYSGGYASNKNNRLFAYTQNFGKQFNFSAAIEDGSERRMQDGVWASYAGQRVPDIVVRARFTPSWGIFHAAAAYHEIVDSAGAGAASAYALNAGMEYRQKWADIFGSSAGNMHGRFLVSGAYARGALDYLGIPRFVTDYASDVGSRMDRTAGTSFVASYEHLWKHNLKTTFSFSAYQSRMELTSFDWKVRGVLAQVGVEYQPVPGLMVGVEGNYFRDSVQGTYFGIAGNRDTARIAHGFFYVRRKI